METFDELYYREPFTREFDAQVVACEPGRQPNTYEVELSETAFYPEGGGQPGDRGTLVPLDEKGKPVSLGETNDGKPIASSPTGKSADKPASKAAGGTSDSYANESGEPGASSANVKDAEASHDKPANSAAGATAAASTSSKTGAPKAEATATSTTPNVGDKGSGSEGPAPERPDPAIHVLDTQKHGDRTVEVTNAPLQAGTRVHGVLDWTWRRDNTEAHTGEHIVSGIVHALYGYNNVGFHMGERSIEVDFDGLLTEEQALDVERRANAAVREDLPVSVLLPSPEELAALDYRSKKELEGPVRLVQIPGVDLCACCGTHLATTGQVGLIKVLRVTTKKKKTRLELLCGRRALVYCEDETRWLHNVSNFLSVGDDEAEDAVRRLSAEKDELKHELKQAHRAAIDEEVAGLFTTEQVLVHVAPGFDVDEQRYYCEQVVGRGVAPVCAVLSDGTGKQAGRVNYVIASADLDLRPACKQLNKQLQGRGGGKPNMVQGSFAATRNEIEAALRTVFAR